MGFNSGFKGLIFHILFDFYIIGLCCNTVTIVYIQWLPAFLLFRHMFSLLPCTASYLHSISSKFLLFQRSSL